MKRDLKIGEKFNSWTVSGGRELDSYKRSQWLCTCACGKEKYVNEYNLVKEKTKSCGCGITIKDKRPHNWSGYEEISGWFFADKKKKAHQRNYEFEITIEEVWDLFIKQNRKCALSGMDIGFPKRYSDNPDKKEYPTASIDRIDSNKGYTTDNIQWVHKHINIMKNVYSENYFIEMCRNVVNTHEITKI